MKYSIIFPGQGAQRPGMGKDLYDKFASSKSVFEEVDEALGFNLSNIIFNGTKEDLMKTAITQPAILTVSIAAFRGMESAYGKKLEPYLAAGHSLGEYTSLVATDALSLADGVRLVHLRGTLMQEAVPIGVGAMSAIVGMNMEEVVEFCKEAAQGEVCEAANINSQEQIVISGHKGAVDRASSYIEGTGRAKVIPLRVSAPFHCELMRPVGIKLRDEFENITWKEPRCPIVTNAAAKAVQDVGTLKDALYKQTFSPVLWMQSVIEMENKGTEGYIEFGPGSVLSGLIRKISKNKRPYPVSGPEELEEALKFLRGGV
ncbi:MAG: ACP S-malonyltransferase [Synergistaceae bacterium]|nr:ACP S-malonyltransferase [Synergistaceae bacterium]